MRGNNHLTTLGAKGSAMTRTGDRRLWNRLVASRSRMGLIVLLGFLTLCFTLTHIRIDGSLLDHKHYFGHFRSADKVFHFGAYFVLTFLVLFVYAVPSSEIHRTTKETSRSRERHGRSTSHRAKRIVLLCLLVLLYGMIDEISQPWFHRQCEVMDLLFDVFGITAGQIGYVVVDTCRWRVKVGNRVRSFNSSI